VRAVPAAGSQELLGEEGEKGELSQGSNGKHALGTVESEPGPLAAGDGEERRPPPPDLLLAGLACCRVAPALGESHEGSRRELGFFFCNVRGALLGDEPTQLLHHRQVQRCEIVEQPLPHWLWPLLPESEQVLLADFLHPVPYV